MVGEWRRRHPSPEGGEYRVAKPDRLDLDSALLPLATTEGGTSTPLAGAGFVGMDEEEAGRGRFEAHMVWVFRGNKRARLFSMATQELTTTPFDDWKLSGPRTAGWLIQSIQEQGSTALRRGEWWQAVLQLDGKADLVDEHHFLREGLEHGVCYEGLNVGELCSFERLVRRYHLLEHDYGDRLRESQGSSASFSEGDERGLFLDRRRAR